MDEITSLICPSCGAKLEIKPNQTTLVCAHCGNEHFIERHGKDINLESHARCPICQRNDRVEKVTAILRVQRPNSALALSLSLPDEPQTRPMPKPKQRPKSTPCPEVSPNSVPNLERNKLVLIITRVVLIIIFLFFLFGAIVLLSTRTFDGAIFFFLVSLGPLIGSIILSRKLSKKRDNDKEKIELYRSEIEKKWRDENEQLLKKWMEENKREEQEWINEIDNSHKKWLKMKQRWEKLYFCHRDDVVFVPGEGTSSLVEDIMEYCKR